LSISGEGALFVSRNEHFVTYQKYMGRSNSQEEFDEMKEAFIEFIVDHSN
jgi:hypothetical protein